MYNINKRKQFDTVGDLKKLLSVEEDESVICLDTEDLEECYGEEN